MWGYIVVNKLTIFSNRLFVLGWSSVEVKSWIIESCLMWIFSLNFVWLQKHMYKVKFFLAKQSWKASLKKPWFYNFNQPLEQKLTLIFFFLIFRKPKNTCCTSLIVPIMGNSQRCSFHWTPRIVDLWSASFKWMAAVVFTQKLNSKLRTTKFSPNFLR